MHHVTDGSLHEEIVTTQSLSSPLLLTVEIIENKPRTTTHHLTTPTSQFFKLHIGGQINSPRTTPLPRIILIIRSNRPKTSGNRGERGGLFQVPFLFTICRCGLQEILPSPQINPTILPQNHSQHSLPRNRHRHAIKRKNLSSLVMTNLRSPSTSRQDICSSTYGKDPRRYGSEE